LVEVGKKHWVLLKRTPDYTWHPLISLNNVSYKPKDRTWGGENKNIDERYNIKGTTILWGNS